MSRTHVFNDNDTTCYYKSSKSSTRTTVHREDGPALITVPDPATGKRTYIWMYEGVIHRDNGPAIERCDGQNEWFRHGTRHRTDGPAIENNGHVTYYVNGKRYDTVTNWQKAADNWTSYKDMTHSEIANLIGKFRIVEWND